MKKKWAIISLINGEEDVIQADLAELEENNNVVVFYLKSKDEDKNNPYPCDVVAMYSMDAIVGWSFDDTGYYDEVEYGEDCCMECSADAYMEGVRDCWNFFNEMLLDVVKESKLKSELRCFFRNNDPIEVIMKHLEDEEDDEI